LGWGGGVPKLPRGGLAEGRCLLPLPTGGLHPSLHPSLHLTLQAWPIDGGKNLAQEPTQRGLLLTG